MRKGMLQKDAGFPEGNDATKHSFRPADQALKGLRILIDIDAQEFLRAGNSVLGR